MVFKDILTRACVASKNLKDTTIYSGEACPMNPISS